MNIRQMVFTKSCKDPENVGCEHMVTLWYSDGIKTMKNGYECYVYTCPNCSGNLFLPASIVELE